MSPLEANFWNLDTPTTSQAICCMGFLDSAPDFAQLTRRFQLAIRHFPRLTQYVDDRFWPTWTDMEDFDLSRHLREVIVEDCKSEKTLLDRSAEDFSKPFSKHLPPWEFIVYRSIAFSSKDSAENKKHAFLFRIHHALADGLGGLEMLTELSSTKREDKIELSTVSAKPQWESPVYNSVGKLFRISKSLVRVCRELFEERPLSFVNGENSDARYFSITEIPVEDLNQLKKTFRCTANELLLVILSRAIHNYQRSIGNSADTFRIIVPVSTRQHVGVKKLGVHLTGVSVSLPLSESDPFIQLENIKAAIREAKADGSVGAYALLGEMNAQLPRKLQRAICELQAKRTNCICSNVPYRKEVRYLAGAKIESTYAFVGLMREQGIGISFVTYAGNVHIGITHDPKIIENTRPLIVHLHQAAEDLRDILSTEPTIERRLSAVS